MKTSFLLLTVVLMSGGAPLGADQTWTGKISDSACGKKHEEAVENEA